MTEQDDKSKSGVFISYRRADTGQVAPRLKKDLISALNDDRIFYDREDLKGGELWKERLKEAINNCSVFLALIGKDWLKAQNKDSGQRRLDEPDDPVRAEVELALEAARSSDLLVVPVIVDEATNPDRKFLPPSIQNLSDHQSLPLRTATNAVWEGDVQTVLARMREHGLVPAAKHDPNAWLARHLQDTGRRFATHMTTSQLHTNARPEELYLDLLVAERNLGKREDANVVKSSPLEDALAQAEAPLLLLGEGGSGKTTSLLYIAARAADRAKVDQQNPIPIYVSLARLTKMEDVTDLHQLIADSVRQVSNWTDLSTFAIRERRRFFFLFDSFNEIPEQFQSTCAVILQRFVEKQASDHVCLIGSRPVSAIESLGRPPSQFKTFEILRLTSDQVQKFLQQIGVGLLYDKMPQELRELAGNPFMLYAIAQTLSGVPESTLPRNRGRLYHDFTSGWMDNEEKKRSRSLEYSYERVKEPLLAYLAMCMTAAGQTSLLWSNELEELLETELEKTYQRIKRRGGMPDNWTVSRCLEEILGDGLLKRVNEQLHFMHQSVQEYFTGLHFSRQHADVLVDFTPKLSLESIEIYELAELPNHRFVSALLMMAGMLDDSTRIVDELEARNPLIAAATISSANRVDGSLLASLEKEWLDLLEHPDVIQQIVAYSSLVLASMKSQRVIQRLFDFALASDFSKSYVAKLALQELGAAGAITIELIKRVRQLSDDDYREQKRQAAKVVNDLQSAEVVSVLFDNWRSSASDDPARQRFEDLLGSVDRALLTQELQKIISDTADVQRSADANRALAASESWEDHAGFPSARKATEMARASEQRHLKQIAESLAAMKDMDQSQLAASLRSMDAAVRTSAARLIAERQLHIEDVIVEALVRMDQGRSEKDLVDALVSLCGEETAVLKLVESAQERCWRVGNLDPQFESELKDGPVSEALRRAIAQLGISRDLSITETIPLDPVVWRLSSWGPVMPLVYEIRKYQTSLEFYDCNIPLRAFSIVGMIPGETSLNVLRRARDDSNKTIKNIAVHSRAQLGDPSLAPELLAQLKSTASPEFVHIALAALKQLRSREALSLIDDLLVMTETWEEHPRWGSPSGWPGWAQKIHDILLDLDADAEIQQRLDRALTSEEQKIREGAIEEFVRWFQASALEPERRETWLEPDRLQRLFQMILSDPAESVRNAAAEALTSADSEFLEKNLAQALDSESVEIRVAAGAAIVPLGIETPYARAVEVMHQTIETNRTPEIRQRAGRVLSEIPGELQRYYEPVQAELTAGSWERTLALIEERLAFLPDDANLFWWRAYALKEMGQLDQAAESYERANQLATHVSMIPQALAKIFLELNDYARAVEAARTSVEISPTDTDAQAILARSSYKAGAMNDAVQAAIKAVALDPVHSEAIWVLVLVQLQCASVAEARAAFEHALKVRTYLSPGLDESFLPVFLDELDTIKSDNPEISQLITEIKSALQP